jgi:hypothetical protein
MGCFNTLPYSLFKSGMQARRVCHTPCPSVSPTWKILLPNALISLCGPLSRTSRTPFFFFLQGLPKGQSVWDTPLQHPWLTNRELAVYWIAPLTPREDRGVSTPNSWQSSRCYTQALSDLYNWDGNRTGIEIRLSSTWLVSSLTRKECVKMWIEVIWLYARSSNGIRVLCRKRKTPEWLWALKCDLVSQITAFRLRRWCCAQ